MPQVPTYDAFRVQIQPGQAQINSPSAGQIAAEQEARLGQGLMAAGDAVSRVTLDMLQEVNRTRVDDAMNQLVAARTKLQAQASMLQGRNALERPGGQALPDEFGTQLDELARGIGTDLGNDRQRLIFQQQAAQVGQQFRGALTSHMVEQQKTFQRETFDSTLKVAADQGALLWRDPSARAQAADVINRTVGQMASTNGWDKATTEAHLVAALSPMHVGVIHAMIASGDGAAAQKYLSENSASLTLQARAQMLEATKSAGMAEQAQRLGATLAGQFDYLHTADAVKMLDAMDVPAELRSLARHDLMQRHAIAQSDADKANAMLVGKLDEMVQRGMPLAKIMTTPEFAQVRDKGTVMKLVQQRQEHQMNLALAAENRDFTRVQRLRAEQEYQGLQAMMPFTDPEVLTSMSREQVAGLVLQLGPHNTDRLLQKWDSFKASPGAAREARIDQDQFNTIADSMGLRPFEKGKSESDARALVVAKDRVETAIALWNQAHPKQEMPRDEKAKLMRSMLTEQVTVKGWLWDSKTDLLRVPESDMSKVAVPDADRQAIIARARQQAGDPKLTPADDVIARAYLARKLRDKALAR